MPSTSRLVLILLLSALGGLVAAAHITDKLVVGIYAEPNTQGSPLKLLSSGTPLEVLQTKGDFVEVRLADDVRGWVESSYVTEEKPAKAMLLETQTKLRALNGELQALKAKGGATDGEVAAVPTTAPSAREAQLRQSLGTAESRITQLEQQLAEQPRAAAAQQQLETLQHQVQSALQLLADAQGMEVRALEPEAEQGLLSRYQVWIVGVAAAVLGFGLGVAAIDYRIRKRYGGFRI